jgi:hypothetical protein
MVRWIWSRKKMTYKIFERIQRNDGDGFIEISCGIEDFSLEKDSTVSVTGHVTSSACPGCENCVDVVGGNSDGGRRNENYDQKNC